MAESISHLLEYQLLLLYDRPESKPMTKTLRWEGRRAAVACRAAGAAAGRPLGRIATHTQRQTGFTPS